jgi:hypothetical protein
MAHPAAHSTAVATRAPRMRPGRALVLVSLTAALANAAGRADLHRRFPLADPVGILTGRADIEAFLTRKLRRELDYVLRKQLWAFTDDRVAVRFQYEWHDAAGQWWRSYGNELWEFDATGLMTRREASINDVQIDAGERRLFGPHDPADVGGGIPLR